MISPPRWAELLLERMLPASRREDIVGDLREEFFESALPMMKTARAQFWYVRQVASVVFWSLKEIPLMGKLLILVSLFTLACAGWLALMEGLLRHAGFAGRIAIAFGIAVICTATILARLLHVSLRGERWLWVGAVALIGIGAKAFLRNAQAAHFEAFVFVISLVLVLQGLLMLASLGHPSGNTRPRDLAKTAQ